MINVDSYVPFIIKHKLTQQQFLLLYLLYTERVDLIKKYKASFPTDDGTMLGKYFTDDLIKRKFLNKSISGNVMSITLTDKFTKLFENVDSMCEQILSAYPAFTMSSGGTKMPLTLVDIDELKMIYLNVVGIDPVEYKEILSDIEYGKKHSLINYRIDKFFKSLFYKKIRELRRGETRDVNVLNITLDDL